MTLEDIAVMGPHLGFTDKDHKLNHPELYPEDWVNATFTNVDWDAVLSDVNGKKTHQFKLLSYLNLNY